MPAPTTTTSRRACHYVQTATAAPTLRSPISHGVRERAKVSGVSRLTGTARLGHARRPVPASKENYGHSGRKPSCAAKSRCFLFHATRPSRLEPTRAPECPQSVRNLQNCVRPLVRFHPRESPARRILPPLSPRIFPPYPLPRPTHHKTRASVRSHRRQEVLERWRPLRETRVSQVFPDPQFCE